MTDSILNSTKKVLGISESDSSFDVDILIHINSVFPTLNQLGIGPVEGFAIEGSEEVWENFIGTEKNLNSVKTYMYMKVKLVFDPPSTSFAIEAMKKQIEEFEWRLNVQREGALYPWTDSQLQETL